MGLFLRSCLYNYSLLKSRHAPSSTTHCPGRHRVAAPRGQISAPASVQHPSKACCPEGRSPVFVGMCGALRPHGAQYQDGADAALGDVWPTTLQAVRAAQCVEKKISTNIPRLQLPERTRGQAATHNTCRSNQLESFQIMHLKKQIKYHASPRGASLITKITRHSCAALSLLYSTQV